MRTTVKLKIADIIIQMESNCALKQLTEEEERRQVVERFNNFFYEGRGKPDILIRVRIVNRLPGVLQAIPVFITYHPDDGSENWRLLKKGNSYVYKCPLKDKKQLMLVNKSFDRIAAYLLPKKDKGRVWDIADIIYDFLQVLLIQYLAQKNEGIFTHAVGVKDLDGKGLLFSGKSGCGKSTTARLWYQHTRAMVLNDDRIIVRKIRGKFFIYGSPWHGDFRDYLASRIERAALEKLFFIYHSPKNRAKQILQKEAFNLLYPALFPAFWDKACLENIVSFSQDLIRSVPCYRFGFLNDRKVIGFVRKICKKPDTKNSA